MGTGPRGGILRRRRAPAGPRPGPPTGAPAPSATCRAPHVNLRLSPDGSVDACCVNDSYRLGRIDDETSVADVWGGERLRRLRDALDRGDYSLGCQDCGLEHARGDRAQTHAALHDMFPQPTSPLPWPKRVEFALSNTCNLQCIQCDGELSSAIRAQREKKPPLPKAYGDAFFTQLRDWIHHIEVATFIGGEPFLARECRQVWDLLLELGLRPELHVTTNGTIWNERVEHYVRELRMNVALSIDGATAETVEAIRVGARFEQLIETRDRLQAITRETGASFILNHCLMVQNWHELGDFLLEADRIDANVHVIPVVYPEAFSLARLPTGQLDEIVGALRVQERTVGPRLGRNRPVWDLMVSYLERTRGLGPLPVVVRPPRRVARTAPTAAQAALILDEAADELRAWSGRPLLEVEACDEVIIRTEVPDWAAGIGLVDRSPEDIGEVMAAHVGPIRLLEGGNPETKGLIAATCAIDLPDGTTTMRSVAFEWADAEERPCVGLRYALGPLPSSSRSTTSACASGSPSEGLSTSSGSSGAS